MFFCFCACVIDYLSSWQFCLFVFDCFCLCACRYFSSSSILRHSEMQDICVVLPCVLTCAVLHAAGYYCGEQNLTAPSGPCQAGYYCPESSVSATQVTCPAGYFCSGTNDVPVPCPKGKLEDKGCWVTGRGAQFQLSDTSFKNYCYFVCPPPPLTSPPPPPNTHTLSFFTKRLYGCSSCCWMCHFSCEKLPH